MDLASYQTASQLVQQLRRKLDRASGALETVSAQMKKELGCKNTKEAQVLLAKLKIEEEELAAECAKQQKAFEAKWAEKLAELP